MVVRSRFSFNMIHFCKVFVCLEHLVFLAVYAQCERGTFQVKTANDLILLDNGVGLIYFFDKAFLV